MLQVLQVDLEVAVVTHQLTLQVMETNLQLTHHKEILEAQEALQALAEAEAQLQQEQQLLEAQEAQEAQELHQVLMEHQQREPVAAGVVDTLVLEAQEDPAEVAEEDQVQLVQDLQTPVAVAEEELIHYHKEMAFQVDLEL
tara:strand:+ start:11 stop:433 length:423 start_codon:yes stop_codon:yes gene_type:complete